MPIWERSCVLWCTVERDALSTSKTHVLAGQVLQALLNAVNLSSGGKTAQQIHSNEGTGKPRFWRKTEAPTSGEALAWWDSRTSFSHSEASTLKWMVVEVPPVYILCKDWNRNKVIFTSHADLVKCLEVIGYNRVVCLYARNYIKK